MTPVTKIQVYFQLLLLSNRREGNDTPLYIRLLSFHTSGVLQARLAAAKSLGRIVGRVGRPECCLVMAGTE
jgi:hypothetical protein